MCLPKWPKRRDLRCGFSSQQLHALGTNHVWNPEWYAIAPIVFTTTSPDCRMLRFNPHCVDNCMHGWVTRPGCVERCRHHARKRPKPKRPRPVHHITSHYNAMQLPYSSIWVRDVFCSHHLCWCRVLTAPVPTKTQLEFSIQKPKHVSNSANRKCKPYAMCDCVAFQGGVSTLTGAVAGMHTSTIMPVRCP